MGVDKSIVLGPYIKVPKSKEITEIKVKRVCPKHPTKNQGDNKFCSECGTLVENADVPVKKQVDPIILIRKKFDDDDSLYSTDGLDGILLPNNTVPRSIDMYGDEEKAIDLSHINELMVTQKEWMDKEYKKEIDYLKEEFGNTNVEVCWGVVHYWS